MTSDTEQDIPTYIWQSQPIISRNFVGGERVLGQLHDLLESNPVVVVLGMHGVGKTELALQYVKKYGEKYGGGSHSLDLRGRQLVDELARYQKDRSAKGIELQTEQTDPSKLSNWYWEKLECPGQSDRVRVLVVLDNVDKADRIQGMLPSNSRFRLLVMMGESLKGQSGLVKAHYHEEELHQLTDKAALELLKKCVGSHRVDEQPEVAGKLCNDLLGNLPLGIELAGGYLNQDKTITIAEFFTELSEMQNQLDGDDDRPFPTAITQERGVKSVLELSWQRLDPKSQEVCKLFGLFAPRAIPWELVKNILSLKEDNKQGGNKAISDNVGKAYNFFGKGWERMKKQVNKTPGVPLAKLEKKSKLEQIPKLIATLSNLRLIKWDCNNNTAILDTLIRSFFAEKAKDSESLHEKFVDGMFRACRDKHLEDKNPVRFAVMVPHLEAVATKYTSMLSDVQFDPLFIKVGRFYDRQWMYVAAFQWYGMWLEKADRRFGSHPCNTDTRLKNLAYMYDEIGNFPEAQSKYKRALQICEQQLKKYPLEKKDLASSLYDLGEILFNKSKYSAALPLYERTVKIIEDNEEKNKKLEADILKADAQSKGHKLKADAQLKADKLKANAQLEADKLKVNAQFKANKLKADAQLEADELKANALKTNVQSKADAQLEVNKLKANAQLKADKLEADAQSKGDKLKADALKVKAQLIAAALIADAQLEADELKTDAKLEADKLIANALKANVQSKANAQLEADKLIADAQLKADELIADKLIADAQLKAEKLIADAQLKAEKLIADAQLKANAQLKAEKCKEYLCCLNNP